MPDWRLELSGDGRHQCCGDVRGSSVCRHHLKMIRQFSATVSLDFLFDTLIVRSFIIISIIILLGCWFWWPQTGTHLAS
ncbi:MMPL family transporter [Mycobacterium uberis]|uniref:MMPL family transporter n=1 Tax=Mycobacterium uberis TaxID=2162698 RepID=UPI0026D84531